MKKKKKIILFISIIIYLLRMRRHCICGYAGNVPFTLLLTYSTTQSSYKSVVEIYSFNIPKSFLIYSVTSRDNDFSLLQRFLSCKFIIFEPTLAFWNKVLDLKSTKMLLRSLCQYSFIIYQYAPIKF